MESLIKKNIISFTNWLVKQNVMICEHDINLYSFRSRKIGENTKYSAEELYEWYVKDNGLKF